MAMEDAARLALSIACVNVVGSAEEVSRVCWHCKCNGDPDKRDQICWYRAKETPAAGEKKDGAIQSAKADNQVNLSDEASVLALYEHLTRTTQAQKHQAAKASTTLTIHIRHEPLPKRTDLNDWFIANQDAEINAKLIQLYHDPTVADCTAITKDEKTMKRLKDLNAMWVFASIVLRGARFSIKRNYREWNILFTIGDRQPRVFFGCL